MGHDDEAIMHTFVVDQITDMTCDAMKPHFTVTTEIQDGFCCLVESNYKHDASGKAFPIS